jgi:hypothetical protein
MILFNGSGVFKKIFPPEHKIPESSIEHFNAQQY